MLRVVALVLSLVVMSSFRILAQEPPLRIGEQVRIELRFDADRPLLGTVLDASRQTLLLKTDTANVPIDMGSVSRLYVNRGGGSRTPKILRNGIAGLLVGAVGGAIVGPLVLSTDCYSSSLNPKNFGGCFEDLTDGRSRLEAAVYFGAAGALLGSLIGALLKPDDRWQTVPLDQVRLAVVPRADGRLEVGMSVKFRYGTTSR